MENYRLFARILVGLLLGNTHMHLKNFAMFHGKEGLRLTPSYDQVCASVYNYKTLALTLDGSSERLIGSLKAKHIIALAKEFCLTKDVVLMLLRQLEGNKEKSKDAVYASPIGTSLFKNQFIKQMEVRWNHIFALIGQLLSTKL